MLPLPIQRLFAPMPLAVAERLGQAGLARVLSRRPALFDRLGEYADRTIVFHPTDLRLEFSVNPRRGTVHAARPGGTLRYDVRIAAPLVLLLALAEGRLDGDAEFFGRQLSIEGDMETALALRNAVENAALDFATDFTAGAGPFRLPVQAALRQMRRTLLTREGIAWN